MPLLLTSLYFLCFVLLTGMAGFVLLKNPRARLNRLFSLGTLALLGWLATLFVFNRQTDPLLLLQLGRLNFVCALLAVFLAYLFVRELAGDPARRSAPLWAEALLLSGLTLLTPLIDRAELPQGGQHVTLFGPLFPLYVLHILVYVGLSLRAAFRSSPQAPDAARSQLRLIGAGILATALIALTADVLLPYAFHDFAFQDVGTLSTILFLGAAGDAVFAHHLFNIRVIVRATFIYAGLIALMLELYSLAVTFLTHLLPLGDVAERHFAATAIALVVNAFTQKGVKRGLEHLIDRSLPSLHPRRRHGQTRASTA